MGDDELEELEHLAKRLDPDASIVEHETDTPPAPKWVVTVDARTLEPVEIRCASRSHARRTLKSSLLELLGERGMLRAPEVNRENWDQSVPGMQNEKAHAELLDVLASGRVEEDLQKCLERHPDIWRFLVATKPQVVNKMPLGHDMVTDFVVFGAAPWSQSQMPTATFVEIERADAKMFTAKGDAARELTHGLGQLRDWKRWIGDHKQEVREYLLEHTALSWERHGFEGEYGMPPFGFEDRYLLVIGRRASMTSAQRFQLHKLCEDTPKTTIVTFDMLLDVVCPEAPYFPPWMWDD